METMGKSELLQWTEEDREKVLAYYSKTAKTMRADIETVKEWLKHLPHIPELPPDVLVEKFLLINRCDVAKAKQKLENYYIARTRIPEFFNKHPLSPEMREAGRLCYCIPLPKLYNLYRIITFKVACEPEQIDVEKYICNTLNVAELILLDDYKVADIFITDLTQTTLKHTILVSPLLTRKMFAVVRNAYSDIKTIQVHFIVSGAFWETGIAILKSCMGAKVKERVHVHKNFQSLHKFVPKEYLPKDFDGDLQSMPELFELQLKSFERHEKRFDELLTMKCDERLKPVMAADDLFGVYGNFKQLDID